MTSASIRWKRVAALVVCVSLLVGGLLAWQTSLPAIIDAGGKRAIVDSVPLDYADSATRDAVLWHLRDPVNHGLLPFASACRDHAEGYRLTFEPGLGSGNFQVVDVRRSGRAAAVVEFGPRHASNWPGDFWQQTARRKMGVAALAPVRAALDEALRTGTPVSIRDRYIDAPRTTLETCQRGRYHFFTRAWSEDDPSGSADVEFDVLARAILALAKRTPASP